jgi:peptidoglycan-associated lipoprotein
MKRYQSLLPFVAIVLIAGSGCRRTRVTSGTTPTPPPHTTEAPAPERVSTPVRSATNDAPPPASSVSRTPDAATRRRIDELLAKISDAYFDYNRHALRPDAIQALQGDSTELRNILKDYPDYRLTIEGYADERGSAEYNLGLGDARAKAAKDYLVQVGIPDGQLAVVSYGNERQVCQEHQESCWQKNRRIHIIAAAQ